MRSVIEVFSHDFADQIGIYQSDLPSHTQKQTTIHQVVNASWYTSGMFVDIFDCLSGQDLSGAANHA